jgi:acetyl-CoA carboxylase carboxyltransferase component
MTPQSQLFTGGPPLVKAAIGEDVTKEELGGPGVHIEQSGVAHNLADDDLAAIALARRYLSYFPSNAWEAPPDADTGDTRPRRVDELLDLIPPDARRPYSMRKVLDLVVDQGSLLEIQPRFGSALVTALARIGGHSVAIVANDPMVRAGTVDSDAGDKGAHFLSVADAFHVPIVLLADNPGVMAGSAAEKAGVLRHVGRMFAAQHRVQGVKLHVTVRKAFGFGSCVMGMNPFDHQTVSLTFPAITLGALPARSGGESAKLDEAERERIAARQSEAALHQASRLGYDEIVDPRDLRNVLLQGLALSANRRKGPHAPVLTRGILI